MLNILITGSNGFIGKNLKVLLKNNINFKIFEFNSKNKIEDISNLFPNIDILVHLAGVQRPKKNEDFIKTNYNLTRKILSTLNKEKLKMIIFSSSVHVINDPASLYSKSKIKSEEYLKEISKKYNIYTQVYRFNNIFGPFGKPNYNSVVANFCYNISHNNKIEISNSNSIFTSHFIEDVVIDIEKCIQNKLYFKKGFYFKDVEPVYKLTLGELYNLIYKISLGKVSSKNIYIPLKKTYEWYEKLL